MATIITYQGTTGSFSHQACEACFPDDIYRGCRTFSQAMRQVKNKEADIALIPIDNSTAGRVMEVYNHLPESGLKIVGEYFMAIRHCLMMTTKAVRGTPPDNLSKDELIAWKERDAYQSELDDALNNVNQVWGHPQALGQARGFINTNLDDVTLREMWDTAGGARDLAGNFEADDIAVIAPELAADIYGMTIIRKGIEDNKNNTTRFLMLARQGNNPATVKEPAITTLMFQTPNKPGSLVSALDVFKKHNINLVKLETYMMGPRHSDPHFYVDIVMNQADEAGKAVLDDLEKVTLDIILLGTYTAARGR